MKVCPTCGTEYGDEAAFCSRDRAPLQPAGGGSAQGLVGQLVAERYKVERRIGEGGMGEVYLATHILMDRRCALKVMSPALSKDADAVSRFNREATNASRISHPNVCTVYDFGLTAQGLVYLAMEYIEGKTLTQVLEDSGPMPVARAADLVAQCAAGLAAAHELGIVHRDLKPDNIMVVAGKDREIVKLVDFGIAKAVEGESGQRVTRTGFVVGTPEYMAPEQLSGDPLDSRADQYSLALVFYRLVTGRLPFEAASIQETLVKRLTSLPQPLAAAHPGATFPAGLQGVMDTALARAPEERYDSVEAFAKAVSGVSAGSAVPTRQIVRGIPATQATPLPPTRRRSRVALAATAVAIVGGGAFWVLQLTGAPADHGTAPSGDNVGKPNPPSPATPLPSGAPTPRPPAAADSAPSARASVKSAAPAVTAVDDTASLDPAGLDAPELRRRTITLAERVFAASNTRPYRRAEAAYLLHMAALDDGRPDSAKKMVRLAYRYDKKDMYLKALRQFGDSVQP